MRTLPLLLALLAAAACDREPAPNGTVSPAAATPDGETADREPPVPAPTGIQPMQQSFDTIAKGLADAEESLAAGETVTPGIARQLLQLARNLRVAARMAVEGEKKEMLQARRARMIREVSSLRQEWTDALQEVQTIQTMLDDAARGVSEIPEGFTEAEMRDRLGDEQERARAAKEKLEQHTEKLAEVEAQLGKPVDEIPVVAESVFTKMLEDTETLVARAEKVVEAAEAAGPK